MTATSSLDALLQICTWNTAGKDHVQAAEFIFMDHYPEALFFQEVGRLHSDAAASCTGGVHAQELREVSPNPDSDLSSYRVFLGESESYLSQVIAIDGDIVLSVQGTRIGKRFVAVRFRHSLSGQRILLINVHFPHSSDTDVVYEESMQNLISFIMQYPSHTVYIGGDWNSEPGQPRHDLIAIPMSLYGATFCVPSQPTRFGRNSSRVYDYFVEVLATASSCCSADRNADTRPSVIPQSAESLSSDHAAVLCTFTLPPTESSLHTPGTSRQSRVLTRTQCATWSVNRSKLQEKLRSGVIEDDTPGELQRQWASFKGLAHQVCHRTPSLKYKDSPFLKHLCSLRRVAADPQHRTDLSRQIIAIRRHERDQWCQQVLLRAAQVDYEAVRAHFRYITPKTSLDSAIAAYNTREQFVDAVHQYFYGKLGGRQLIEEGNLQIGYGGNLQGSISPFQCEEVQTAISSMKPRKTSGPSGVSTDYIRAVAETEPGLRCITNILNEMGNKGALDEQRLAQLVLAPKRINIALPKDFRPLTLMEPIHKLFMTLLIRRLQSSWDQWREVQTDVCRLHGLPMPEDDKPIHEGTWGAWLPPCRVSVPWYLGVWFWSDDEHCSLKWLSRTHGWCQLGWTCSPVEAVSKFLLHLPLMDHQMPFAIQLLCADEELLGQLQSLHRVSMSASSVVLLERVPPSWLSRVLRL